MKRYQHPGYVSYRTRGNSWYAVWAAAVIWGALITLWWLA